MHEQWYPQCSGALNVMNGPRRWWRSWRVRVRGGGRPSGGPHCRSCSRSNRWCGRRSARASALPVVYWITGQNQLRVRTHKVRRSERKWQIHNIKIVPKVSARGCDGFQRLKMSDVMLCNIKMFSCYMRIKNNCCEIKIYSLGLCCTGEKPRPLLLKEIKSS